MDRKKQSWGNNGRWHNKKPPRGSNNWLSNENWQPTMPSWEKDFCRAVGSFDWKTFLQIKKYAHLDKKIMGWDDSEVEEAFVNAKNRYWAQINGIPCDVPLPNPNLHIQEIDWDNNNNDHITEFDPDLLIDYESEPVVNHTTEDNHEPVIIFGDALIAGQSFSVTGWGDEEENVEVVPPPPPANDVPANNDQGWGDSVNYYSNDAWGCGDGSGQGGTYVASGGGDWNNNNSNWGWNNWDDNGYNYVGPDNGAGGQVSNYGTSSRGRGSYEYRSRNNNNYGSRNDNRGRYRGSYRGKRVS